MNKKIITSIVSVMLVAAMLFAGCGKDVSYIGTFGEVAVDVADYNAQLLSAFGKAQEKTGCEMNVEAVLSQEIDGISAEQWLEEEAMRGLREMLAVEAEFERLGMVLPVSVEEDIKATTDSQWEKHSQNYSSNGITYDAIYKKNSVGAMSQELFKSLYGAEGEKALSNEEMAEFFDEMYMFFRVMAVSKKDAKGVDFDEEKMKEQLAAAEDYRDRLLAGEDPEKLVIKSEEEMIKITGKEIGHSHAAGMKPHITALSESELFYSVEATEFVEKLERGEVDIYKDNESFYLVVQKLAAIDYPEILEENRMPISYSLCKEDFDAYITSLTEQVEIVVNEDALKFYNPRLFVLE